MPSERTVEDVVAALREAHPELETIAAASAAPIYVVGGAVRDALLGRGRADLDLVVEGDAAALAAHLGAEPVEHQRFGTARVELEGHRVDLATARAETYPQPGALPEVTVPAGIESDLGRRDFTINAMAVPLAGRPQLLDPHGGEADLGEGLLRVLHDRSFLDDPTRAIRAARYAARFGFELEPGTERLLRATDLGTVSADRREAELLRLADEPTASAGFALLGEWGLLEPADGGIELAAAVSELLAAPPWRDFAPRAPAVLAAALGGPEAARELVAFEPARPSQGVDLASGRDPVELVLARARGAAWLDGYIGEWRTVELEIDGADLIAAGISEGPAVGRGLAAAKRRKLDGEVAGREQELAAALAAARAG